MVLNSGPLVCSRDLLEGGSCRLSTFSTCAGHKRAPDSWKLEIQVVVKPRLWVLGTLLRSSLQEGQVLLTAKLSLQPEDVIVGCGHI